jgi:ATP-dependent RNA helicase RhlE
LSFNNLQLIEPLLKALSTEGYTTPTPVQQKAIPVILQQSDVLACAQTGTGKTAAFAIPLLQLLHQQPSNQSRNIRALILVPTRELAIQVSESFQAYGRHLSLKHLAIFGGVSQVAQVSALRRGIDTLIATPGRLLDLINQRHISLQHLKFLVLDEADRMLDMGFIHDVKRIVSQLPVQRQTVFFSATMPPEIQQLSQNLLKQPVKIEVTPVSTTVERIEQSIYHVDKQNKRSLLLHLLNDEMIRTALVFARTKHGADKIARDLSRAGITTEAIHGNKSQNARQSALQNFKSGRIRVLVATDIAARGIDIDGMSHVFNYELPEIPETYVHRIGRTGRAGAGGVAISFCDRDERAYLANIQKLIRKTIPVVAGHGFEITAVAVNSRPVVQDIPAPGNRKNHFRRRNNGNYQRQRAY